MSPPVERVPSTLPAPRRTDVVVIGGGIVGTSTALFLQRRGLAVAVCEKGEIAAEQSSRNWGWCRSMGRDHREIPLILESLRIWQGLGAILGRDVGYRRTGILYLSEGKRDLNRNEHWLEHARTYQIGSRLINADEVAQLIPGLTRKVAGGLYTASDGRAEPALAAPAIARAIQERGGAILTGCAVRSVETTAGRLSGVITEKGAIACTAAVLAGGAWSRLFCGNLGIELPQLKVLGSVLRTKPLDGGPESALAGTDVAFRRRLDGGYTVAHGGLSTAPVTPDGFRLLGSFAPALRREWRGLRFRLGRHFLEEARRPRRWPADQQSPFERHRILDPAPDHALLERALAAFRRLHPALAGAEEAQRWGGMIDVTPDAVPVISPVKRLPGLFIATGFSGHGFGLGPGAGRLMADLVAGDAPVVDPAPFRLGRFSDGSAVTIDAGL